MIKIIEKYRLILIAIILIVCILNTKSPFEGYYSEPPFFTYLITTFSILILFLIPTEKLIWAEKIIYSFIASIVALLGGFIITEILLGKIYGYDTNYYDELQSPAFLENVLFYLFTNLIGIGIFAIFLKYKKPIYR